jgi:hypothetical protein
VNIVVELLAVSNKDLIAALGVASFSMVFVN